MRPPGRHGAHRGSARSPHAVATPGAGRRTGTPFRRRIRSSRRRARLRRGRRPGGARAFGFRRTPPRSHTAEPTFRRASGRSALSGGRVPHRSARSSIRPSGRSMGRRSSMAHSPNVVLLNEHPAEQAFLRYFLSSQGIPASSLSHREGLDALAALAPDVVILDEGCGKEAAQRVKARLPNARVALVADATGEATTADAALRRPLDLSTLERDLRPLLSGPPGIEASRKRVLVVDDDQDILSL